MMDQDDTPPMTRNDLKAVGLRMIDLEVLTGKSHSQVWRWFKPGAEVAECAVNIFALWQATPEYARNRIIAEARARRAARRQQKSTTKG